MNSWTYSSCLNEYLVNITLAQTLGNYYSTLFLWFWFKILIFNFRLIEFESKLFEVKHSGKSLNTVIFLSVWWKTFSLEKCVHGCVHGYKPRFNFKCSQIIHRFQLKASVWSFVPFSDLKDEPLRGHWHYTHKRINIV
jgi:hypothetical protein